MKFISKSSVAAALSVILSAGAAQTFAASIEADVALSYSPDAATRQGGEDNIQVNLANALMGANALHEQSGTGVRWRIAGFVQSAANPVDQDNNYILGLVNGDAAYADVRNFAASVGADLVSYFHHGTGAAGNAYQPGNYSAMQEQWLWLVVVAHELGHNYGGNHQDDHTSPKGIMMHNYCGGGASWPYFFSSPNLWQDGVQLTGDGQLCIGGSLVNGGDNAWTISSQAQSHADIAGRVSFAPSLANVVLRWCFTNAAGSAPASTTNYDLVSGAPAVVRGVGATYTGKALRTPGGTTGNTAANSISAYLDLPNGILSSRTDITIEIWCTPLSAPNWARICDFGRTVEAGNGAPGEWTGAPGTPAPGGTSSSDGILLSASVGTDIGAQRFQAKLDGTATTLDSGLPTAAGVQHHYAITFTDGAGAYGAAGGRWQWYRDAEPIAFLDVNHHLANLEDVNNWLGRSLWSGDNMANNDYAEVRISDVAMSRGQLLANSLLGPNYFPNANVTLNGNDAFGSTSFNAAGNWSSGAAPSGGNKYETYDFSLRTPATASGYTFAGDALTMSGGQLLWKGTSSSTITLNNLILNSGKIANAGSGTFTLAGSLKLTNDNVCSGVNGGTTISAALSGNGSISFLHNTATLTGNNSSFTGRTFVGCGAPGGLTIDSEARLGANPSTFTADQLTLNRGWLYTTTTTAIDDSNRGIRLGPSGGIFNVAAGTTLTLAVPVSSAATPAGNIIAGLFIKDNSGTMLVTSPSNTHSGPMQISGGTLNVSSAGRLGSGSYAGPVANNATFIYSSTATQTLSGPISGTGTLTKSGPGFLTLSGANTMSGAVTVSGGTLYANSANAANNRAFSYVSGITVNSGATFRSSANALFGWDGSQDKPITVNAGGVLTANGGLTSDVGVGTVTLAGGILATLAGGATDFGSWRFDNAGDKLLVTQDSTASAVNVKFANGGAIDVAAGRTLNFTGTITDTSAGGASAVVKSGGSGVLLLANANTYSGTTTVSNGTLLVNGSIGGGAVTITGSATLGGNGTIGGAVTIESGATLLPGTSPGVLTVNSDVTLSAGSATLMEISKSPLTNDQLRVTGALTCDGALTVTNLGGTLAAGDNFQLFVAGSTIGTFAATNLPALNSGLAWNFNAASGLLSVVPTVATNPTNISYALGGGSVSLSWPSDHTGWRLQTQTNPLAAGLGTNWFDVAGSTTTNAVTLPVDASNASVFYRLAYP